MRLRRFYPVVGVAALGHAFATFFFGAQLCSGIEYIVVLALSLDAFRACMAVYNFESAPAFYLRKPITMHD
jgi:hypothetical protein